MDISVIAAILIFIAVVLFWLIMSYNGFVKLRNSVEEAFATMDVYLKKRADLIPNLVETVKGYASHERDVLENVTDARSLAAQAEAPKEKLEAEEAVSQTLRTLFAVAENYPDLKANTNFLQLQKQVEAVEEDIANSRKFYNAVVKMMNTRVEVFPSNLIAKMFHFKKQPMFQIDSQEDRKNVRIRF